MSFSDPLSVTFAAPLPVGAVSLPRVSVGNLASSYKSSDGLVAVSASHQLGKRTRDLLRIDYSKISADIYLPDTNVKQGMSFYLVFDRPAEGQFTNAEAKAVYTGFKGLFTASTDAMIDKLLGLES
jgi:hypothetical protein